MPQNRDPLDSAREELRSLRDSDDWEEKTTPDLHFHVGPENKQRSSSPPKGVWAVARWILLAIATAIGTGIAAYLKTKH